MVDYCFRYIEIVLIKSILLPYDRKEEESSNLSDALLDKYLYGVAGKELIRLHFVVVGDILDRIVQSVAAARMSTVRTIRKGQRDLSARPVYGL